MQQPLDPQIAALAKAQRTRTQVIAAQANAAVDQAWDAVDPNNVEASWAKVADDATAAVASRQLEAARGSDDYVSTTMALQGVIDDAEDEVVPSAFAGVASDGRGLLSLLNQPSVQVTQMLLQGAEPATAMQAGRNMLGRMAVTQVQDAARVSTGVAMVANRAVKGYMRMTIPPSCSRCLILSGKIYKYNASFERHPRCDCTGVALADLRNVHIESPEEIYAKLSVTERQRAGWSLVNQQAIADGADLYQVTNIYREGSLYTAGGLRYTREGTTARGLYGSQVRATARAAGKTGKIVVPPRMTPDAIYKIAAGDRDKAIELLRQYGYVVPGRAPIPMGPLRATPAKKAPVVRKKPAAVAKPAPPRVVEPKPGLPSEPQPFRWPGNTDAAEMAQQVKAEAAQQAARARQEFIDEARKVGETAAEVVELVGNAGTELDVAMIRRSVERVADRLGIYAEDKDRLLAAIGTGDADTVLTAVFEFTQAAGVRLIGSPGDVLTMDRKIHKAIDTDIKASRRVEVVRPGYMIDLKGESVVGAKAVVEEALPAGHVAGDGLDQLALHSLRSLATEFELPGATTLPAKDLIGLLREAGVSAPDRHRVIDMVRVRDAAIARYQPSLSGLEDLARLVREDFPGASYETFEGGMVGAVQKITTRDGELIFAKRSGDFSTRDGTTITDAEQLASLVGRALDAPVPRLIRSGETQVYTDWAEGRAGGDWYTNTLAGALDAPPDNDFLRSVVESDQGRRLGLLDLLIQNGDRHGANWLVSDAGMLTGIDHGGSWWFTDPNVMALDDQAFLQQAREELIGPFVRDLFFDQAELDEGGLSILKESTVMTQADVDEAKRRLETLRPDFARLGHEDWLDYSQRVLDLVRPFAVGTRSIFL